jgi:hypothetical protein
METTSRTITLIIIIIIIKIAILYKGAIQIQCNPYQNTTDILHRTRKKSLKYAWKHERFWIAKAILSKENKSGDITISVFKTFYMSVTTKIA